MGLKEVDKRRMRREVQVVDGEVEVNDGVIWLAAKIWVCTISGPPL
jgi:hypothetical protein